MKNLKSEGIAKVNKIFLGRTYTLLVPFTTSGTLNARLPMFNQEPYHCEIFEFLHDLEAFDSYFVDYDFSRVYFKNMDDAVLCHMTFSG